MIFWSLDLCGLRECILNESAVAPYLYTKIQAVLVEVVDDDELHPCPALAGVTSRHESALVPFWSIVPLGIIPKSGFRISDLLSGDRTHGFLCNLIPLDVIYCFCMAFSKLNSLAHQISLHISGQVMLLLLY